MRYFVVRLSSSRLSFKLVDGSRATRPLQHRFKILDRLQNPVQQRVCAGIWRIWCAEAGPSGRADHRVPVDFDRACIGVIHVRIDLTLSELNLLNDLRLINRFDFSEIGDLSRIRIVIETVGRPGRSRNEDAVLIVLRGIDFAIVTFIDC